MRSPSRKQRVSKHKILEDAGRLAVLGWLAHPKVAELTSEPASRALINHILAPLNRDLTDQLGVTLIVCRALNVIGYYPDGTEWPNPFARVELSDDERSQYAAVLQVLTHFLTKFALILANEGVPLDPEAPENLVVLAQLLALEIDWSLSIPEVVDGLNVLPSAGWSRDGRGLSISRHASQKIEETSNDLRRSYRAKQGDTPIRAPYAGGEKRGSEQPSLKLKAALLRIAITFPSIGAGDIHKMWSAGTHRAVKIVKQETGLQDCPARSTLFEYWSTGNEIAAARRNSSA